MMMMIADLNVIQRLTISNESWIVSHFFLVCMHF